MKSPVNAPGLTRQCPFTGCDVKLTSRTFACRKHWHSLKEAEKTRITWAWEQYLHNVLSAQELKEIQQQVLGDRGKAA